MNRWKLTAFVLACVPLAAGAQESGFAWAPPSASSFSGRVDAIYYFDLILSTIIASGVCFTILFFCWKYRRGSRANRANAPAQNRVAEATWITVPLLLALGTFVWASRVFYDLFRAPKGSTEIYVVGKQWMWKLQHPDGRREIDELHVPVGQPTKLILTSQDVIHSFFVPAFRIKQDVLPSRVTTAWFQATHAGRYHLFCSQYCGLNHAKMGGWVYAMSPSDYEQWLSHTGGEPTMAARGAKLYQQLGCSGCHGESNTVRAPSLAGIYNRPVPLEGGQLVVADDRYIHNSIVQPKLQIVAGYKPVMPSYEGRISADEILELVAFVKSMGEASGRVDPRFPGTGNDAGHTQEQQRDVKARLTDPRASGVGGSGR